MLAAAVLCSLSFLTPQWPVNSVVIGRRASVAASAAEATSATTSALKPAPTRLLVKNVAWEASESSLLNLFSQFGDVEAINLARPKKSHHARPHLGWAHISFANADAAAAAVEAARGASLYSRRLRVGLADVHTKPSKAQRRPLPEPDRRSAVEERTAPDAQALPSAQRASLLRRLETLSDAEEVESCVNELGQLPGRMSGAEYAVIKAAWKRSVSTRVEQQRGAPVVEGITAKQYINGEFGI
mmetsp:Transcript_74816/g.224887  ORF Transcript_74816/g.224887 Transcript_74816/m.224887 type:complete len:243 (+) Transcript_74816:42-770(+)